MKYIAAVLVVVLVAVVSAGMNNVEQKGAELNYSDTGHIQFWFRYRTHMFVERVPCVFFIVKIIVGHERHAPDIASTSNVAVIFLCTNYYFAQVCFEGLVCSIAFLSVSLTQCGITCVVENTFMMRSHLIFPLKRLNKNGFEFGHPHRCERQEVIGETRILRDLRGLIALMPQRMTS